MAPEALDQVGHDSGRRLERVPLPLVVRLQREADLCDATVLVEVDVEVPDELALTFDADLSRLSGDDVDPGLGGGLGPT